MGRLCNLPWLLLIACLVSSCASVGPAAISNGRLAYNEAITETNNQQMLMVPVHNRYGESNHLLAVASVTANVRVSSRAQFEAGVGNNDNYSGNLVPFSGGFVYEENPTISYTPVAGERYLHQLTSPIPLSLLARIVRSKPYPGFVYFMLISSVNGIANPAFLYDDQKGDPDFQHFVEIMTALERQHCLSWVTDSVTDHSLSLVINVSKTGDSRKLAQRLLEILELPSQSPQIGQLVIPVSQTLDGRPTASIGMTTRTIWDLLEILSAVVEVPATDLERGIVADFPKPGLAGNDVVVRYADTRPTDTYVGVEYRDGWFYIDSSDQASKRYFKLLGSLWSAAMAQTLDNKSATPVLTVPVSR